MFTKKRKHFIATITILFLLSIFAPAAVLADNSELPDSTVIFGGVCQGIYTGFLFDDPEAAGLQLNALLEDPDYNQTAFMVQNGVLYNVWERGPATLEEALGILACFKGYWQDADTYIPFVEEVEYTADLRMQWGMISSLFRVFVDDTNVPDGVLFSVEDGAWESADKTIGDGSYVERLFIEDSFTLNIKDNDGNTLKTGVFNLPTLEDFDETVTLGSP